MLFQMLSAIEFFSGTNFPRYFLDFWSIP